MPPERGLDLAESRKVLLRRIRNESRFRNCALVCDVGREAPFDYYDSVPEYRENVKCMCDEIRNIIRKSI